MATRLFARAARLAPAGPSRMFVRAESTAAAAGTSGAGAFEPALPHGQEPAYDLALEFIDAHNAKQRKRLEAVRAKAGVNPTPEQEARIARLEVDAWINDPATRRLFERTRGRGSMDRAVMRELAERAWRRDGPLDLVMQRLFQLGVVPDLVPDLRPFAEITLSLNGAGLDAPIEAGSVVSSASFAAPPQIHLQLFHHPAAPTAAHPTPEAKFTLLMVDPDSPDHENHTYTQRVHYAKADVPLSVLSGETDLFSAPGTELLPYEPPAPAKGSGKHRYVFVVVRQNSDQHLPVTRDNFELRAFLAERELTHVDVAAATLFRAQWTDADAEHINATYLQHRGEPAPEYGLPPKEMKYGYPLNAKEMRREALRQEAWNDVLAEIEGLGMGKVPGQEA